MRLETRDVLLLDVATHAEHVDAIQTLEVVADVELVEVQGHVEGGISRREVRRADEGNCEVGAVAVSLFPYPRSRMGCSVSETGCMGVGIFRMNSQIDLLPQGQRRRRRQPVGGLLGELGKSSDHLGSCVTGMAN